MRFNNTLLTSTYNQLGQQITATLPVGLTAGSYDLRVVRSNDTETHFHVAYGATGPQGPAGPQLSGSVVVGTSLPAPAGYTYFGISSSPFDIWTTKVPMPLVHYVFSAAVVNSRSYAISGNDVNGLGETVEAYDPTSDTWTTKTPMPTPRFYGLAAVLGN